MSIYSDTCMYYIMSIYSDPCSTPRGNPAQRLFCQSQLGGQQYFERGHRVQAACQSQDWPRPLETFQAAGRFHLPCC